MIIKSKSKHEEQTSKNCSIQFDHFDFPRFFNYKKFTRSICWPVSTMNRMLIFLAFLFLFISPIICDKDKNDSSKINEKESIFHMDNTFDGEVNDKNFETIIDFFDFLG